MPDQNIQETTSVVRQYYDDSIELIRRKIKNDGDINLFTEFVIKDEKTGEKVKQDIIHQAMQEHIDWCFTNQVLCGILAPWGHGKTAQVAARALCMLGIDPNLRIKILCDNDKTAKDRLKVIGLYIDKDDDFHTIFPECVPLNKDKDWNAHALTVRRKTISKDPSVECFGVLSSGIGGRCDLLIADDVVDMRNTLLQPKLKEQVISMFHNTWLSRADGIDFKVLYIATVWTDDDLSSVLLKNPAFSFLVMGVNDNMTGIKCRYYNREMN
jgi:hypothetical protein